MNDVTLVISTLGPGGAERVLSSLANHWSKAGRKVAVVTLDDGATPPFYRLAPEIERVSLGLAGASPSAASRVLGNLRRVLAMRRALRRTGSGPIVSFMDSTNVLVLLASRGLRRRVIVAERIDPHDHDSGRPWATLRRVTYPFADRVVVQTRAAAAYFDGRVSNRVVILPNPVMPPPTPDGVEIPLIPGRGRHVVALGRLVTQKGFDLLLRAFARVAADRDDWHLVVWGEGPAREALESERDALGLTGRAHFPGRTRSPSRVLERSEVFVLPSRYEGFPNALCEAMAAGVASIAFDCPSGPAEILRHGHDGLLVPPGDVDGLAEALAALMDDVARREALASRARSIVDRFEASRVFRAWDACIDGRVPAGSRGPVDLLAATTPTERDEDDRPRRGVDHNGR